MNNTVYFYEKLPDIITFFKFFFIIICTYFSCFKLLNVKKIHINVYSLFIIFVTSIVSLFIKNRANYFLSIVILVFVLSILNSLNTKNNLGCSMIVTTIAIGLNYIILFLSVIIDFIPNNIFHIKNDYINFIILILTHITILIFFFRIRRFKNGLIFIQKKMKNEYFDLLILNINIIIVFVSSILNNLYYINKRLVYNFSLYMIVLGIIMFITIQKTLMMYYKHKLLVSELNEAKDEIKQKNKELQKLEQENLNFSKTSHSIVHRQKVLENKLNELMMKNEIGEELDIADKIKEISKEYSKIIPKTELSKSGITQIDDMLKYMQTECVKNKINFELKLNGDIHYMVNHYVTKQELEILLADHIKDAIIAIQHLNNINKSILVKLGIINGEYSLYVYDSGIEFEIDTLLNLGDKPITTHENEGGTGMGFLNTFDTLNRHNASLIINEIGSPVKDNYTKAIIIKFNNKHEFKIKSYRIKDFENKNHDNCKFDFEE